MLERITKPLSLLRNSRSPATRSSRIFIISIGHRRNAAIFLARLRDRNRLASGDLLRREKEKRRKREKGKNNAYDNSEVDNESRERSVPALIYLLIREPATHSPTALSFFAFLPAHSASPIQPASTVPRSGRYDWQARCKT